MFVQATGRRNLSLRQRRPTGLGLGQRRVQGTRGKEKERGEKSIGGKGKATKGAYLSIYFRVPKGNGESGRVIIRMGG